MKTMILTVLTTATLAITGCAVDPTSSEPASDDTQAAITTTDVSLGGRGGVAVAADPQKRVYDFDKTPRLGQRNPYEVNLGELEAVGATVPFAAADDDLARRQAANCGAGGCK